MRTASPAPAGAKALPPQADRLPRPGQPPGLLRDLPASPRSPSGSSGALGTGSIPNRLLVGSGQTEVGKKWWPSTTYAVDGSEFRTEFRTDASGYRARPEPFTADHPYRIAFVGDSFTEAMQVPYDASFCAGWSGC